MVSSRTDSRKKRRELLKIIISNLIDLYGHNDSQIERTPLMKLNSILIDSEDFLKWARIDRIIPTGREFLTKCKMHLESEVPVETELQRDMND